MTSVAASTQHKNGASRAYAYIGVAITLAVFAGLSLTPASFYKPLISEGRPIESLSTVMYFVAALLLLARIRSHWPFVGVLVFFGLREMDMDKRPFTEGLFKSRQYLGDTVDLPEKLLSAVILILLITIVVVAMRRAVATLRTRGLDGVSLCVLTGLFLGFTAKMMDGLGRKLAPWGIDVPTHIEDIATLYEEVAEMGMALCLLLACVAVLRAGRKRTEAS
mgnify:CR=1 FL=1